MITSVNRLTPEEVYSQQGYFVVNGMFSSGERAVVVATVGNETLMSFPAGGGCCVIRRTVWGGW